MHTAKWKLTTLTALFGSQELLASQLPSIAINVEAALMEALVEAKKDEHLDDRAVEICSDETDTLYTSCLFYPSQITTLSLSAGCAKSRKFKYKYYYLSIFSFFGSNLLCSRDSPYATYQVLGVSRRNVIWTGINQTWPNYESHTSPISLPI